MPKKRAASIDASRLTVLATGDERAFLSCALELLASRERLAREAALEALVEKPLPGAREALRDLYFHLDEEGLKRDQSSRMRVAIVRVLTSIGDARDGDIAIRACDTRETAFGEDVSWTLRVHGLRMLVELAPDAFPFYAIEHLDDVTLLGSEPANTAFQLLAGTGNFAPIYQWLLAGERDPAMVAAAFELLADGPREIVQRYASRTIAVAIRRGDEALSTVLAEAIVEREFEASYADLEALMSAKISDELYNYLAVLLAGTNRPALLAILERQLRGGRRPRVVAEAMRVRATAEKAAILRRWEDGA